MIALHAAQIFYAGRCFHTGILHENKKRTNGQQDCLVSTTSPPTYMLQAKLKEANQVNKENPPNAGIIVTDGATNVKIIEPKISQQSGSGLHVDGQSEVHVEGLESHENAGDGVTIRGQSKVSGKNWKLYRNGKLTKKNAIIGTLLTGVASSAIWATLQSAGGAL